MGIALNEKMCNKYKKIVLYNYSIHARTLS